ncbi:MAG: hypothetical protein ACREEM_18810 [Blastocatellia bacterium]
MKFCGLLMAGLVLWAALYAMERRIEGSNDQAIYTPHNSGADNYPYLIITAFFTDPAIYSGRLWKHPGVARGKFSSRKPRAVAWSAFSQFQISATLDLPHLSLLTGGDHQPHDTSVPQLAPIGCYLSEVKRDGGVTAERVEMKAGK